ncbi:response regulator [Reichenbachiella agarivorans]|uniref:histidine kinase n=1 Tax=Reichenbachiella agarivorans TaxID=2979464 RepID=A0ABY6CNM8_9BACT|nr:response regulator [Reichenbachiella agarivorans]UXP32116.1 response regulator [Reichenbachiella agarivorans]
MKTNILLIEDDKIDQLAFERFCKRKMSVYHIDIAGSVAIAKVKLSQTEYDIVITDYQLGDGDAFDVISECINSTVIFISGAGNEDVIIDAMKSGAQDFLIKDSSRNYLKVLPLIIEKALQQREDKKILRTAEKQIKQLSLISQKTTNPVILFDKDQNIEWVNDAYLEITQYTKDEIIGQPAGVLQRGANPFDDEIVINKVVRNKGSHSFESINYTRFGTHYWAHNSLTPICDDNHDVTQYIIVQTDLTQKKEMEEALIHAKESAIKSEQTKQNFLANMSHEIRTPMNSIIGFTKLLSNTQLNVTQKKYLEAINWSSNHLLRLVNDILDMSKIESGKIQFEKTVFDLKQLVDSCMESFTQQISEKELSIKIEIDKDMPQFLVGDPVRIYQILTNLISNSIKFTSKGSIAIKVFKKKVDKNGYRVGFEVSDTGIGIPADRQDHVFDVFTQANSDTTRKYGGTGLGLPIVKQLVELQQGNIFLTSKEGKGSKFEFSLLLSEAENIENVIQSNQSQNIEICNKKILIVEDHEMNQFLIKATLDGQNLDYDIAKNGKAAIDLLKKKEYDLILMDLHMPIMDGIRTTQIIRNLYNEPIKNIPIIAMTASAMSSDLHDCMNCGMNDYISKPFKTEELFSKIEKWCNNPIMVTKKAS